MSRLRSILVVASLILSNQAFPNLAKAQEKETKAPDRVGRVIIEGNTDTPDRVILQQLRLQPAQVLDYAEVKAATKRLAQLGLFDLTDPPVVEVLPNELDSEFKDIRIRIKERPWNWAIFAASDAAVGMSTLNTDILSAALGVNVKGSNELWSAADRVRRKILGPRFVPDRIHGGIY